MAKTVHRTLPGLQWNKTRWPCSWNSGQNCTQNSAKSLFHEENHLIPHIFYSRDKMSVSPWPWRFRLRLRSRNSGKSVLLFSRKKATMSKVSHNPSINSALTLNFFIKMHCNRMVIEFINGRCRQNERWKCTKFLYWRFPCANILISCCTCVTKENITQFFRRSVKWKRRICWHCEATNVDD